MIIPAALVGMIIACALFAIGLACLIARRNLLKMVMGLEFLGNGVSLLFIVGGFLAGDVGLSQAIVFTLIAIEAVIAGLALALVILARKYWQTFDCAAIFRLTRGGGT
ncbi:MAG: NADH-quinone oxidoreductase subunit K [Methanoregula sp.]|jgi:NADH-quinone oxidoreductase subunit K|nr:NADH-quinone oxidoreductase subunit K [Methanoregula sp.]